MTDAPALRLVVDTPGPLWSRYTGRAAKCDACLAYLVEIDAAPARHRRRAGRSDLIMCDGHAREQRALDAAAKGNPR